MPGSGIHLGQAGKFYQVCRQAAPGKVGPGQLGEQQVAGRGEIGLPQIRAQEVSVVQVGLAKNRFGQVSIPEQDSMIFIKKSTSL